MSPTFEISYFDLGNRLAKILDNNSLMLDVEIIQPSLFTSLS